MKKKCIRTKRIIEEVLFYLYLVEITKMFLQRDWLNSVIVIFFVHYSCTHDTNIKGISFVFYYPIFRKLDKTQQVLVLPLNIHQQIHAFLCKVWARFIVEDLDCCSYYLVMRKRYILKLNCLIRRLKRILSLSRTFT